MKLLQGILLLCFCHSLFADDFLAKAEKHWQKVEQRATLATRLSDHKKATSTGQFLSESTVISDHQYQSLILAWRLDNQLYRSPKVNDVESETEFELSELSYSFSLLESENDFWQIGKFNTSLDPGYALRSVGFFESKNNPFDDFSSTQGINMVNLSLWLDSYYLSLLVALEGTSLATEDLKQWALVLQKDYHALSTSLMLQQYEKNHIGLGSTFTYVLANSWEFHGSGFIRQGSVWHQQFSDSQLQYVINGDAQKWHPKFAIGGVWTVIHLQLLMEYSYQKDKLTSEKIDKINDLQPQSVQEGILYKKSVYQLYTQAYQQHYLFTQLQYSIEDHIITANSLIGEDISALSQLKYEYLATSNLSGWLSIELASGEPETEFKRIPWQNRIKVGLQWKI
jgi:hypothetical protein